MSFLYCWLVEDTAILVFRRAACLSIADEACRAGRASTPALAAELLRHRYPVPPVPELIRAERFNWQVRTADFKQARDLLLQKMNTSQGDALVQVQADKARLEVELRALKRQRCSACLAAAGAGGQLGESTPAEEHAGRHI